MLNKSTYATPVLWFHVFELTSLLLTEPERHGKKKKKSSGNMKQFQGLWDQYETHMCFEVGTPFASQKHAWVMNADPNFMIWWSLVPKKGGK